MDLSFMQVPAPVALAIVATIGYLLGRRGKPAGEAAAMQARRELRRAHHVARELEKIAWTIGKSLASHNASVSRFKQRVGKLCEDQQEVAWKELCEEAEQILKPTLRLATELSNAYEGIRQQSANLMTFTEARTDPLTGLNNRRAFDDALTGQFAMMSRYEIPFSLAMFDIDNFKQINDQEGHLHGDHSLQELAKLLDQSVRETDIVCRYGGEEFVIIMPQTALEGACTFSERLRSKVRQRLTLTVSGGVTAALDGDNRDSLLARADAAMYEAKAAGRDCVFCHDGDRTTRVAEEGAATPV